MFRKTLVSRALSIAFGAAALSVAYAPMASAQSNATGTIYGTVPAGAGTSVVIENVGTNARRTATPDATGKFNFGSLQPGQYKVTLQKGDAVVSTQEVEVLIGQGTEAAFAAAGANQLSAVQVTGRRAAIDVRSTDSTSTFTARQLSQLPIAQNLTSILLLAPDTVRADPRYAGGASIGGGAPSENAYYINGFPVTNPLSQLGSIELPFGAIQNADIRTGGFGAEFGRSTGGVVSITTKSGTNEWHGGANAYIQPNALRSKEKNIYYPGNGTSSDGTIYRARDQNKETETQYGLYIGGPLIKDKLFMFLAADKTYNRYTGVSENSNAPGSITSSTLPSNGWVEGRAANTRYLAKFDWIITDDHRLEWTTLGDKYVTDETSYGYDYATRSKIGGANYTSHFVNESNLSTGVGGTANVLKYTGNLTQDLTLTALYGQSKSPHRETFTNDLRSGVAGVLFNTQTAHALTPASSALASPPYVGRSPYDVNYGNPNPLSGQSLDPESADDKTRSFRLDVEYALGKHTIRAGMDENRLSSGNAGQIYAGGSTWTYYYTGTPGTTRTFQGQNYVIADGSPLGNAGYYVRQSIFNSITNARSDQSAQYLEDRYQPTKNVLVTLGLRREGFTSYNGEGKEFISSKNFYSPRLGASWDVNGDASMKVFGNLGRYSIQTPTHVAVRGAGVSTLTYQYFTYTGTDAFGRPTGLNALTGPNVSPDGETGAPKDPNSVAAKNLKPSYQDELILGMEKSLAADLTVGAKATYRRLGNTLDDTCDTRPFHAYAAAHGIDDSNYDTALNPQPCLEFNPGRSNKFLINYNNGNGYTPVTLSQQDFGNPKPKRTFLALDFFAEHPFQNGWYGRVSYTWSKNKGNTEGQTKSDNGQTDVSATSTWDFHELMENSYGYLPNDRRHQVKAFGIYQVAPEWAVGANLSVASGRPKNCLGNQDNDPGYGSIFFSCAFTPGVSVPVPRGTMGRLMWDYSLDANVAYSPAMVKGLKVRFDIFNVLNRQSAVAISEIHEANFDNTSVLPTYGRVIGYSAPRYARISAQYDF